MRRVAHNDFASIHSVLFHSRSFAVNRSYIDRREEKTTTRDYVPSTGKSSNSSSSSRAGVAFLSWVGA